MHTHLNKCCCPQVTLDIPVKKSLHSPPLPPGAILWSLIPSDSGSWQTLLEPARALFFPSEYKEPTLPSFSAPVGSMWLVWPTVGEGCVKEGGASVSLGLSVTWRSRHPKPTPKAHACEEETAAEVTLGSLPCSHLQTPSRIHRQDGAPGPVVSTPSVAPARPPWAEATDAKTRLAVSLVLH